MFEISEVQHVQDIAVSKDWNSSPFQLFMNISDRVNKTTSVEHYKQTPKSLKVCVKAINVNTSASVLNQRICKIPSSKPIVSLAESANHPPLLIVSKNEDIKTRKSLPVRLQSNSRRNCSSVMRKTEAWSIWVVRKYHVKLNV